VTITRAFLLALSLSTRYTVTTVPSCTATYG
jgi:hypothetical protein